MTAVVVGAGFSGVIAARELVRTGWEVVLVDPGAQPGRGLAYGRAAPWHLLNSPAGTMSADPDDPNGFARFADIELNEFAPRTKYGEYLTHVLTTMDNLTVHKGQVSRIFEASGGGLTTLLADDVVIPATIAILATGNPAPSQVFPVEAPDHPGYIADPWRPGALENLPEGPILLAGTGLTAIDVTLTLSRTGNHPRVDAVSRHGLLPLAHTPHRTINSPIPEAATLSGLMREIANADFPSLRPHWNELWQRLSTVDQSRFLRHLSRYWEILRHRMPPQVAADIAALRETGFLNIARAEICGVSANREVVLKTAKGIEMSKYSAVVNCTGPGSVSKHPLVRTLIADGLAQPGPHGMGLLTDNHGALIGRSPRQPRIFTLGTPRRGVLWETTAVPEIRGQARALATHLAWQGAATKRYVRATVR